MNLSNRDELKIFLKHSGLKPKDYLGQNFLADEEVLQGIVTAADLNSGDTVLEVGPGLGVLTRELATHAGRVIAVEKDQKLIPILKRQMRDAKNLEIINQDILRFHLEEQVTSNYKVVANIPYYLTSKLFQYFLERRRQPEVLILMVQKEVGERVVAQPGGLSVLGISIQVYADPEILLEVPRESFWPVPEVDSVVLRITPRRKYPEITDEKSFFRLIKIAFAGKRKQVHNTLANGLKLPKPEIADLLAKAKIDPTTRPQDVEIEQWIALYREVSAKG